MSIAEKKALRAAIEKLEAAQTAVKEKTGLDFTVEIDSKPVDDYDFDALGRAKADVLADLGKVPASIIEAVGTIAEDADYREAFAGVSTFIFVPAHDAQGSAFDYDKAASLADGKVTVTYAPLAYMHGGYERAIQGLF